MSTQKEVVFNAVKSIMGSDFKEGMNCGEWFKARPEMKKQLQASVVESFNSGELKVINEQENINSYITGLISNHLRKDTRLNGGEKYTPANPGSRAGQSDPQIKEARKLLKTLAEGSEGHTKTQAFIDGRLAEIKAEKQKVSIDKDALPAELQGLVR